ncbi:hypothetical protein Leryth_002393 [Lithospermum erythrorhizon]|nr:hypothetical protein Leryth_002393 [Lithospermum erythrorhizon]
MESINYPTSHFGVIPYNSILGETHHASRDGLNVLLEQVSHHPPVTALHATNEKENIESIWCLSPKAKFYGTHIAIEFEGTRKLKLHSKNETYIMNMPTIVIRLLPLPSTDWFGNVTISCQESGIRAELCYRGNSFLRRQSVHRAVRGKIYMPLPSKDVFEISGYWDRHISSIPIQFFLITKDQFFGIVLLNVF